MFLQDINMSHICLSSLADRFTVAKESNSEDEIISLPSHPGTFTAFFGSVKPPFLDLICGLLISSLISSVRLIRTWGPDETYKHEEREEWDSSLSTRSHEKTKCSKESRARLWLHSLFIVESYVRFLEVMAPYLEPWQSFISESQLGLEGQKIWILHEKMWILLVWRV